MYVRTLIILGLLLPGCNVATSTDVEDLEEDVSRLAARVDSLAVPGTLSLNTQTRTEEDARYPIGSGLFTFSQIQWRFVSGREDSHGNLDIDGVYRWHCQIATDGGLVYHIDLRFLDESGFTIAREYDPGGYIFSGYEGDHESTFSIQVKDLSVAQRITTMDIQPEVEDE